MFLAKLIGRHHINVLRRPCQKKRLEMWNHKNNRLIAATDKKIYFSKGCDLSRGGGSIELPISKFLSHEYDIRLLSTFQQCRSKILLIAPDHWFKHDFYPFKSQRDSLIKPFIERKLKTTYPHLPLAAYFFSYLFRQRAVTGPGVRVFHLYEPSGYDLYEALCKTNLQPRWITSAALLWEKRCKLLVPDFPTQATLLIHLHPQEAFLYFYFQGDFLFSRAVNLPESAERFGALLFEVNQSIYLFSQKAKSDLNKIYLIGDAAGFQQHLTESLGRPVQIIAGGPASSPLPRDVSHLEGLLEPGCAASPGEAYSVTHSKIQQEVKWRPVQWVGILVAALLLLFFIGEQVWLEERLQNEIVARSQLRQQQPTALAEYDAALAELAEDAKRISSAHMIFKIVSSLPEDVLLNEFKMDSDASRLDLSATVFADTVDRFRQRLKVLIENMNRRLKLDPPITVEDMVFNLEQIKSHHDKAHYKIAWKINLP